MSDFLPPRLPRRFLIELNRLTRETLLHPQPADGSIRTATGLCPFHIIEEIEVDLTKDGRSSELLWPEEERLP